MDKIADYINSGIIEMYLLGLVSETEQQEIEKMALAYNEVRVAINSISLDIEKQARINAVEPPSTLKPMILSAIHQLQHKMSDTKPFLPPILHQGAVKEDYELWLSDPKYSLPKNAEEFEQQVIGLTDQVMTAIVWVKKQLPWEVHNDQIETFMILEGTCEFIMEDDLYKLAPGHVFSVPLNKRHRAKVTSVQPCKLIVQRIKLIVKEA